MQLVFTESYEIPTLVPYKWLSTFAPFAANNVAANTGSYYGQTGSSGADVRPFSSSEQDATCIFAFATTIGTNWSVYMTVGPGHSYSVAIQSIGGAFRITDVQGVNHDTAVLPTETGWIHLALKVFLHASAGTITLWRNGIVVLNLTGLNTKGPSNGLVDGINMFLDSYYMTANKIDDVYVMTGSDAVFPGPARLSSSVPNGNGATSGLNGSDGNSVDNYLLVSDVIYDTTYVAGDTNGMKDTYAVTDSTFTPALVVVGVAAWMVAEKDSPGSTGIEAVARLSATEAVNIEPDRVLQNGTLQAFRGSFLAKPAGGTWTVADLNNAEFGVEVTVP